MSKRVSIKHKRRDAPAWVFNWRQPGRPTLAYWLAVLVAGGGFALLLTTVSIRISPPLKWAAPKATVMHVGSDEIGRALTLRAREGGPFPSRMRPSEWEGAAALERTLLGVSRWTPPRYVPVLRDLPDDEPEPLRLAARGEPVLPKRRPAQTAPPAPVKLRLVPVLHPLSGIRAEELPVTLPPMEGAVDAAMTAEPWRFLVRLDASGRVRDCVSLAGGDENGPSPMEAWLRRVTFNASPGTPSRWIAVGVGFANQPAADGADLR